MSKKNARIDGVKKVIVIALHYGKISDQFYKITNKLRYINNIHILSLKIKKINHHRSVRGDAEEINAYYEEKLLQSTYKRDNVIFICDRTVMASFLTWAHDFAPRVKAAIFVSPILELGITHLVNIKKIAGDASAITCPIMLIISKAHRHPVQLYKDFLKVHPLSIILDEGLSTTHLYKRVHAFILSSLNVVRDETSLINADKAGSTFKEMKHLSSPEKKILKRLYWKTHRAILYISGYFSEGIRIGIKTGFDSGAMLDYIYHNKPNGKGGLGVLIDKFYLNNISWQGVRCRESAVHDYLLLAINTLIAKNKTVNILDIAAGHAKYLFDLTDPVFNKVGNVTLRDYDLDNCIYGQKLISDRNLNSKITYEKGDAFSLDDLASLPRDRTIAVASGFYELFENNENVMTSLKGIYHSLEDDGLFIYTNILLHPRHDYMARVMIRHNDRKAWVVRRRFQSELDQLVLTAGFIKISQRVDPWGIFSISLAVKCRNN